MAENIMPEPIAYAEYEGSQIMPWVSVKDRLAGKGRNPSRCHAVFFADGSVLDMVNGWRPRNIADGAMPDG